MDGNIQKALWLGVSILMFVAVVMIGMSMFTSSQEMAAQGTESINKTSRQLSNAEYGLYDNKTVSGSDVSSALSSYQHDGGDIQIIVDTLAGPVVNYVSDGTPSSGALTAQSNAAISNLIKTSQNKSNSAYINPYGEFYATLIYDTNDVVRAINFVQQ